MHRALSLTGHAETESEPPLSHVRLAQAAVYDKLADNIFLSSVLHNNGTFECIMFSTTFQPQGMTRNSLTRQTHGIEQKRYVSKFHG